MVALSLLILRRPNPAKSSLRQDRQVLRVRNGPHRKSPEVIPSELRKCYQLIARCGRGVVYIGSSRVKESDPLYRSAYCLSGEIADILGGVTTWSGIGPGLMDAVTKGAIDRGFTAAGFKILMEKQEKGSYRHPYLPLDCYETVEFLSARKFLDLQHGLVDAAMRHTDSDKTAIVGLPGGFGTLDEVLEVVTLLQLGRLGTNFPVPILLYNYEGFFDPLLEISRRCVDRGFLTEEENSNLYKVFSSHEEIVNYLKVFYKVRSERLQ